MESGEFARLRDALLELLDLEPAERQERLAAIDAAYPADASRLRDLLAADAREEAREAADPQVGRVPTLLADVLAQQDEVPDAAAGARFGPYRLIELLGRGGMGEVYRAQRDDGLYDQEVAIKLLRRGLDSEDLVRRFERERRILGRLDHPGIARLFDAGIAEDGRPFFVLERVAGGPIDEHVLDHGSTLVERLRLLIQCCDAMAAAHRALVVHRDLKPSNVFVTPEGLVKVLDFGIAKALADDEDDAALTRFSGRLLTPRYAAPEQILGEPASTATDVYSLGVLLFELLTGESPHSRGGLNERDLADSVDTEKATRPSDVLARAERGTGAPIHGPAPLGTRPLRARSVRGDLDTIVLKAMQREPARRYASAAELGEDLRRFLAGHPVVARPDTTGYRLRRFVGRHRLGVAAGSAIALTLALATVFSLWQARSARIEAAKATAMQKFVFGLFDVNRVRNPEGAKARQTTAEQLLKLAAEELERGSPGSSGSPGSITEPEVRVELLAVVSGLLGDIGLTEDAERLVGLQIADLEKLGVGGAVAAGAWVDRGIYLNLFGRLEDSRNAFEKALQILDRDGDRESKLRGWALYNLGQYLFIAQPAKDPRAEQVFRQAITALERHPPSRELINAHYGLGRQLERQPDLRGAERAFRAGLDLAQTTPGIAPTVVAGGYQQLSRVQTAAQDFSAAETSARRALEVFQEFAGPDHRLSRSAGEDLGRLLDATDRPLEALPLLEAARVDSVSRVGPLHSQTVGTRLKHATATLRSGDVERALDLAGQLRRDVQTDAKLSEDRGGVAALLLARALLGSGRVAEAESLLATADQLLRSRYGPDTPWLIDLGWTRAEGLRSRGDIVSALAALTEVESRLVGLQATAARRATLETLRAETQLTAGSLATAAASADRALVAASTEPGREFRRMIEARALLVRGRVALATGEREQARVWLGDALVLWRATQVAGSRWIAEVEAELERAAR